MNLMGFFIWVTRLVTIYFLAGVLDFIGIIELFGTTTSLLFFGFLISLLLLI
jgi:hypothetical protein